MKMCVCVAIIAIASCRGNLGAIFPTKRSLLVAWRVNHTIRTPHRCRENRVWKSHHYPAVIIPYSTGYSLFLRYIVVVPSSCVDVCLFAVNRCSIPLPCFFFFIGHDVFILSTPSSTTARRVVIMGATVVFLGEEMNTNKVSNIANTSEFSCTTVLGPKLLPCGLCCVPGKHSNRNFLLEITWAYTVRKIFRLIEIVFVELPHSGARKTVLNHGQRRCRPRPLDYIYDDCMDVTRSLRER